MRGKTFDGSRLFELLEKNKFDVPRDQVTPGTNVKLSDAMTGDEAYL
jgi:hypothetical protein